MLRTFLTFLTLAVCFSLVFAAPGPLQKVPVAEPLRLGPTTEAITTDAPPVSGAYKPPPRRLDDPIGGVFLGGTILPGLALSARALHEHTAQLPLVEIGSPTETLGKDTESAIRNGIFAMMTGALREITERYATEIGKWPPLILTGGDAEAIAGACDFVDGIVPDLCLDGLVLAYKLHAGWDEEE